MALARMYLQLFTGTPCSESKRVGCRFGLLACSSVPAGVKCAAVDKTNKEPSCTFYKRQGYLDARSSRLLEEPFNWKKRLHG